jgi:hypothetical protein
VEKPNVMTKSTNQFKAVKFKEVTVTGCFKAKQIWRRASLVPRLEH